MTTEELQVAELRPWVTRATTLVGRRLRAARSHAELGRMTDAADQLDELERSLADEILAPARSQFYRRSFLDQRRELAPEIVDLDFHPTPEGDLAARRAPIGGQDQYAELKDLVGQAASQLRMISGIGAPGDPSARVAYHEAWERRHRDTIVSTAESALSDAQISLYNVIGLLMIRPEIR